MKKDASSNKQKWLEEHDILLAAGLSSPRPVISEQALDFWTKRFDSEDLGHSPEVAKALEEPETAAVS